MRRTFMESLCRDCLAQFAGPVASCPNCGGARIVSDPDLARLSIAHVDCDAFYASVEKRDDPSLEGKPVIVGGGRRGVVSTCCYVARLYGVRSAMPMFKAVKACPQAVVVKPRYEAYSEASGMIREKMLALTPLVQFVSIDEAYLDLSGTEKLLGAFPAKLLAQLSLDIQRDVGVTVSIGLSQNRFLAKTASEMDKPRGFSVLSPSRAEAYLGPLSPRAIHGVGPKLASKLERDGFRKISDLQQATKHELQTSYGDTGLWLKNRAHGKDNRPVDTKSERKSISSETTFMEDISDPALLEDFLWHLSVKVADRAKSKELDGIVVTLKLKRKDFKSITRRVTLPEPTQLARKIFLAARPMLKKESLGAQFRLIGVGISSLSDAKPEMADLVDESQAKWTAAERAVDKVRSKFGAESIQSGRSVRLYYKRDKLGRKDN
ncbi:MAG: DNA polymerase IV [Pseudomonadota bacterium]